ncbi:MAG: DEAD/DEAH box helicase family protein [Candidatus Latescibacteria bacterium]|nr:DEAD/DEAH box helicase family protein [Candidatus Latescibacterota bacterium]
MPDESLLIQPVESPVICKPYYEPTHYWEYDRNTGGATKLSGRRPAAYWYKLPDADTRRGQTALQFDEDRRDLPLVNKLRADVKRWRQANWEGATNVTKDLLRHWTRQDRSRRFFFCQIEAAETIIFLNEIRGIRRDGSRGKPRWNPQFTDQDFAELLDQPFDPDYLPLHRLCCKMATGSGKTVVMAMLVAWAFCDRGRVPSDERFPRGVLVCCPNLTIKERLQVLRTDTAGEDYYTQFDIVPQPYRDLVRMGKVLVTNWHFFAPESEHSEGGKSYRVVQKGEETDDAFARNRLGELFEYAPLMVLNDEGHHAYRPAPMNEEEAQRADAETRREREEATIWVQGLDRTHKACGIKICVDLSATPFYLKGSGYAEGEPFPWIVSDFGLVDAIESGITKIPRLPVSDTTGRPDPKYFRLWKNITENLAPGQRMANRRPKPEVVWDRSEDALVQLAGEYRKSFTAIQQSSDTALKAPPVMILVCDNTDIAQLFFEQISGQTEAEEIPDEAEEDEEENSGQRRQKKAKKRVVYGTGKVFPELFQNEPGRVFTLRIDSKQLEKVESEDPDATRDQAARQLREVVNTVGKIGKPGQEVRCVVSVAMLTEGWDANNVTHILGLRAFGSQLLCEQVVGRGLRRMNYTPDPETELLPEEYVDVYGIPFSVIPYKGKTSRTPVDHPVNHVKALPERAAQFEIRFPNVEGYVYSLCRPMIKADVAGMEPMVLEPEQTPTATFLRVQAGFTEGFAGVSGVGEFIEHNREEYYARHHLQEIEFEIARQVVAALVGEGSQAPVKGRAWTRGMARHQLFPQVLRIVRRFVLEKVDFRGVNSCELGLEKYGRRIKERLLDAIEPDERQGEAPLLPMLNPYKPIGSTAEVDFTTRREVHSAQRSHLNAVVLDSQWEQTAAFYLEQQASLVHAYARNERPFLLIPYEYEGVQHHYEPDYVVRLVDDTTLILEVKGEKGDDDRAKHQAARRWIDAVNNWGRLGRWDFLECQDPQLVPQQLRAVVKKEQT